MRLMQVIGDSYMYAKFSEIISCTINFDQKSALVIFNNPKILLMSILYRFGLFPVKDTDIIYEISESIRLAETGAYDHLFSDKRPIYIPRMNLFTHKIATYMHCNDNYNEYGMSKAPDSSIKSMITRFLEFGPIEIGHLLATSMIRTMAEIEERRVYDSLDLREEQGDRAVNTRFSRSIYQIREKADKLSKITRIISEDFPELVKESMLDEKFFIWVIGEIGNGITNENRKIWVKSQELRSLLSDLVQSRFESSLVIHGSDSMAVKWNATAMSRIIKSLRMVLFNGFWEDPFSTRGERFEVWKDILSQEEGESASALQFTADTSIIDRDRDGASEEILSQFVESLLKEFGPELSLYNPTAQFIRGRTLTPSFSSFLFMSQEERASAEENARIYTEEAEARRIRENPEYRDALMFRDNLREKFSAFCSSSGHAITDVDLSHSFNLFTEDWFKRPKPLPFPTSLAWTVLGMYKNNENQDTMTKASIDGGYGSQTDRMIRGLKIARYVFCQMMQYSTMNASERVASGLHPEFFPKNEEGESTPGMIGTAPQNAMKKNVSELCMRLMQDYSDPKSKLIEVLKLRGRLAIEALIFFGPLMEDALF